MSLLGSISHGDSGGPLFLADGRVVALATWGRRSALEGAPRRAIGSLCVRVDALSELPRHHGPSELVPSGRGVRNLSR